MFFLSIAESNSDYFLYKYLIVFFISFLSNTFSGISGGGAGLLQLPALILYGIPYYQALATHKIATVFLGLGSSLRNHKSLKNDKFILAQILIFGTPGVILGASFVEFISEEVLYLILGVISVSLAFYSFINRNFGLSTENKTITLISRFKFLILIFLIGILNGSISSGTGLLVTLLLVKTFEINFLRATSLTFFSVGIFWNAIGAIFLSKIGFLPIDLLLVLTLGSFTGGFFGAHISNLKGNKLIKKTFNTVCLLVGINLLIKSINYFISSN